MPRYYLAGPMSNIPQFNFPKFAAVADLLRDRGMLIVSPAELDEPADFDVSIASPDGDPEAHKRATGKSWADILARDVRIVSDQVDGIIFLEDWWRSRGAKLEAFVGLLQPKFEFYRYDDATKLVVPLSREEVAYRVFEGITGQSWAEVYRRQTP